MLRELRAAGLAIIALTFAFGLAYPLALTGVGQALFADQADGSLVERDGVVVGSRLIGQDHEGDRRYFQGRPSVTGYAPSATFFNNLGPNSRALAVLLTKNVGAYLERERPTSPGLSAATIPSDAVTTSASGVDPHISAADAAIQVRRVARARGIDAGRLTDLIDEHTDSSFLGFAGEDGVNVLELNLALDQETGR